SPPFVRRPTLSPARRCTPHGARHRHRDPCRAARSPTTQGRLVLDRTAPCAPPAKPPAAGNRSVELASCRRWRRKLLLGALRPLSCFPGGLALLLAGRLQLPPQLLRLEVGLPPLVGLGTARIRRTRLLFKPSARRQCAPLLFSPPSFSL